MKISLFNLIIYIIGLVGCSSGSNPRPEKSYIGLIFSNSKTSQFLHKDIKESITSAYCSMGLNKTDLEDAIYEAGYRVGNEKMAVMGDGGIPSILLERLDQSSCQFRFFVSRSDLVYVDVTGISLNNGKWEIGPTETEKSDYFDKQLSEIKILGKRIRF